MHVVPYLPLPASLLCVCAVSVYFVFDLEPLSIQFHLSDFSLLLDADISWDFFRPCSVYSRGVTRGLQSHQLWS